MHGLMNLKFTVNEVLPRLIDEVFLSVVINGMWVSNMKESQTYHLFEKRGLNK